MDLNGLVDDAEYIAVLVLVAAGDMVEVHVAAEGGDFEIQLVPFVKDVVADVVDIALDGVVKAVDVVAGEDDLLAMVEFGLAVEVEIVGGGVLFKDEIVVDGEDEIASDIVFVEVVGSETVVVVDVGRVVEDELEVEIIVVDRVDGVTSVVVGGVGVAVDFAGDGEVRDVRERGHPASGSEFALVGDDDAEGECVVRTECEAGLVNSVLAVGELCRAGVAVEVGKDGGIVDDGEVCLAEEEVAVGKAQGDGFFGLGLADEDGKGLGLRATEFDDFAA